MIATLAISQPLLSILGENPTFFTAHSSSPGQIVAFAILVALVPAFVLSVVMLAAHARSDRLGQHIFGGSMAALTFLFVIQVVDVIGGFAWLVIAIAIAATYGLMTLYVKHERVRSVVSVLAVLPPVVVVYFLFFSAANSVGFPDDVEAVTLGNPARDRPLRTTSAALPTIKTNRIAMYPTRPSRPTPAPTETTPTMLRSAQAPLGKLRWSSD